jgi:hypothetical protein
MSGTGSSSVESDVYEQAVRLSATAFGEVFRVLRSTTMVGLGMILSGAVIAAVWPSLEATTVLVAALVITFLFLSLVTFRDARLRSAAEICLDHDRIESASWRRTTGTKRPRGRAAMERWLRENPTGPGRVTLLVQLGRFEEADDELARQIRTTPDELFSVASDRQYRIMFTGGTPDLAAVREAWQVITDPGQRHHRRECLALQEAQAGLEEGRDPLAALVAALPELGRVQLRCRVPFLVANLAAIALVTAAYVRLLRVVLGLG